MLAGKEMWQAWCGGGTAGGGTWIRCGSVHHTIVVGVITVRCSRFAPPNAHVSCYVVPNTFEASEARSTRSHHLNWQVLAKW